MTSRLFEEMRREAQQVIPPGSHALTEHLYAIQWLCARLEAAEEKLAKLEVDAAQPKCAECGRATGDSAVGLLCGSCAGTSAHNTELHG